MSINQELELGRPMEDFRHEAVLNIVRTSNLLSQKGGLLFRRFGLTEAQFNVLFVLRHKERMLTQSDLGKRLLVTRASVTSVLDKLEKKGLIRRSVVRGNRRIYHVDLTAEGLELINEVEPLYRKSIQLVLKDFDEEACRELIVNIEKIRARCHLLDDSDFT